MVNLVVRQNNNSGNINPPYKHARNHLQPTNTFSREKGVPRPSGSDRIVPSPIRVPSYPKERRSVSPLTASESMFGGPRTGQDVDQSRSQSSEASRGRDGGVVSRMAPHQSAPESESNVELTCDYDRNVTPLYELLESSHWDQARLRCRTHPEEVQTWIIRRDQDAKTRWRLLPLHAAVIFQAPLAVIEGMLKEFPMAAGKRDDQGMLPLHLAFRHKQEDALLGLLLAQYPQAVTVKDRRDRLPVDHGKESLFSSTLMQKYADAFSRCQTQATRDGGTDTRQEERLELKAQFDGQMAAVMRKHEGDLRDLRDQMEKDEKELRTLHEQEMDELRDLLSREVSAGQHVRQLEAEREELQSALAEVQAENHMLKTQMHSQGGQYDDLKAHLEKVLADQKTLHMFCSQQQDELEKAQQVRDQLLQSLLQQDEGKNAVRSSREISQLSDNIRLRTEQILSKVVASSSVADIHAANIAGSHLPSSPNRRLPLHTSPATRAADFAQPHRLEENTAEAWGTPHAEDHGDDISAITDDHF